MLKENPERQPGLVMGWLAATMVGLSVIEIGRFLVYGETTLLMLLVTPIVYPFALIITFPLLLVRALMKFEFGVIFFASTGLVVSVPLFMLTQEFFTPLNDRSFDRAPLFFLFCLAGCCAGYVWWKTEEVRRRRT